MWLVWLQWRAGRHEDRGEDYQLLHQEILQDDDSEAQWWWGRRPQPGPAYFEICSVNYILASTLALLSWECNPQHQPSEFLRSYALLRYRHCVVRRHQHQTRQCSVFTTVTCLSSTYPPLLIVIARWRHALKAWRGSWCTKNCFLGNFTLDCWGFDWPNLFGIARLRGVITTSMFQTIYSPRSPLYFLHGEGSRTAYSSSRCDCEIWWMPDA